MIRDNQSKQEKSPQVLGQLVALEMTGTKLTGMFLAALHPRSAVGAARPEHPPWSSVVTTVTWDRSLQASFPVVTARVGIFAN